MVLYLVKHRDLTFVYILNSLGDRGQPYPDTKVSNPAAGLLFVRLLMWKGNFQASE